LGKKEISGLGKGFDRDRGAKFFVFATIKRREPISAHLTNQSVTWDLLFVALEGY
jgi:hypothetical protein